MEEKRTALEGLATALVSDDLTVKKDGRRGDVDYLIALGQVGQRLPAGASAMVNFTLTHDRESLHDALRFAIGKAKRLAQKQGWNKKPKELIAIAEKALRFHLSPACSACEGRGYKRVKGSPMLSGTPCPSCHGTGRQPYPLRNGKEIGLVVAELQGTNGRISRSIKKRLC